MALTPNDLPPEALEFLRERHLATLTTLRPDGSLHVVPIAFTYEHLTTKAQIITSATSRKALNLAEPGPAVLCQLEGRRWLTLEGEGVVITRGTAVRDAEQRYAVRYRTPRPNPERVVISITVTRVMGNL